MKLLKSLLLCFLFFGLGNFQSQKIEKISNEEQLRFFFVQNFQNLLIEKYAGKRNEINFKNFIKFSLSKNKKDFGNIKTLTDLADDCVAIS